MSSLVRGAEAVAAQAMSFRRFAETSTRVLVNGIPGGVAWSPDGSPFAVLAFTVKGGRIVAIDVLADPDRLAQLDLTVVARLTVGARSGGGHVPPSSRVISVDPQPTTREGASHMTDRTHTGTAGAHRAG